MKIFVGIKFLFIILPKDNGVEQSNEEHKHEDKI